MLKGTTYILLGNTKTPKKTPKLNRVHTTYYFTYGLFSHFISFLKNATQLTTHNLEPTADTGLIRDNMEFFESGVYHII